MKALLVIAAGLIASFYFTDLQSENGFYSLFLPFLDFLFLCALAIWIAARTGWKRVGSRTAGSGIFSGFFDGGGDGGSGCD